MTYDPTYEAIKDRLWYVGSENGDDNNPNYQYHKHGWPFFIGIKETSIGKTDFHIAIGIQCLQAAEEIVRAHNKSLNLSGPID